MSQSKKSGCKLFAKNRFREFFRWGLSAPFGVLCFLHFHISWLIAAAAAAAAAPAAPWRCLLPAACCLLPAACCLFFMW